MSPSDHEPEERELRALFDATAEQPSGPELTKLGARALDVPRVARRRARWLLWLPAGAFALGAAVVLLLARGQPPAPPVAEVVTGAPSIERPPAPSAVASMQKPELQVAEPEPAPEAVAELDDLAFGADPDSEDLLGVLSAPASDDELDEWLALTDSVLGEDG